MAKIRWLLGRLILTIDTLTAPRGMNRSAEAQSRVDRETARFALYQFRACPFCVKTRRTIRRLALDIELRDAQHDAGHSAELVALGGKRQVPCLRIEHEDRTEWLYESSDINAYLDARFDKAA